MLSLAETSLLVEVIEDGRVNGGEPLKRCIAPFLVVGRGGANTPFATDAARFNNERFGLISLKNSLVWAFLFELSV